MIEGTILLVWKKGRSPEPLNLSPRCTLVLQWFSFRKHVLCADNLYVRLIKLVSIFIPLVKGSTGIVNLFAEFAVSLLSNDKVDLWNMFNEKMEVL